MHSSNDADPLDHAERARSNFVRELVQSPKYLEPMSLRDLALPAKRVVQFWDDLDQLPHDVGECMESWRKLESQGFELQIFDENAARDFIHSSLGPRYSRAYDMCYHPSMKSDYFRYVYIFVEGGFYVDADDVFHETPVDHLFVDGRLKLQPFCYDIASAQMVPPSAFIRPGNKDSLWIFYFNTTPLIAGRGHPIVERALLNATVSLEADDNEGLPEVQATTGPGNLTRSVFEHIGIEGNADELLVILHDWESTSTSKWPLSYREDSRNWRLSNQQVYHSQPNRNDQ